MPCTIREWRMTDAKALAKALNNRRVQDNLRDGLPLPYTEEDAKAYIEAMLSSDKDKVFAFAITVEDNVIGSIGAFRRENIHVRTAEIGYYLAEPYWGKGLGTDALKQTCAFLFERTNLLRLFAEPFAHNAASCRILEKAGFSFEGTMRKNAEKNGAILDMKLYARVRD